MTDIWISDKARENWYKVIQKPRSKANAEEWKRKSKKYSDHTWGRLASQAEIELVTKSKLRLSR